MKGLPPDPARGVLLFPPVFEEGKPSLREWLAQGHTAGEWWRIPPTVYLTLVPGLVLSQHSWPNTGKGLTAVCMEASVRVSSFLPSSQTVSACLGPGQVLKMHRTTYCALWKLWGRWVFSKISAHSYPKYHASPQYITLSFYFLHGIQLLLIKNLFFICLLLHDLSPLEYNHWFSLVSS